MRRSSTTAVGRVMFESGRSRRLRPGRGRRRPALTGAPTGLRAGRAVREVPGHRGRRLRGEGYRPRDELVAMMHAEVGFQAAASRSATTSRCSCSRVRHDGRRPDRRSGRTGGPAADAGSPARVGDPGDAGADVARRDVLLRLGEPDPHAVMDPRARRLGRRRGRRARRSWPVRARRWRWWRRTRWPRSSPARSDHREAFARYEERLAPLLAPSRMPPRAWVWPSPPKNRFQLLVRNTVMKLMGLPQVADLAMGRSFHDAVELPSFPAA